MNRLVISDLYTFKPGVVYNFGKNKLEAIHVFSYICKRELITYFKLFLLWKRN